MLLGHYRGKMQPPKCWPQKTKPLQERKKQQFTYGNQRKRYPDYHKLKTVWESSPGALTVGNEAQMANARSMDLNFPPSHHFFAPWQLYLDSGLLVSKLTGYADFGKQARNCRHLWAMFRKTLPPAGSRFSVQISLIPNPLTEEACNWLSPPLSEMGCQKG